MSPAVVLSVLVAGAVGSVLRYIVSLAGSRGGFPWPVLLVNVVGSAVAGAVLGLDALDPGIRLMLLTGFAGGLTTYSTFAVETVELAHEGRMRAAVLSVTANLLLGAGAAALAHAVVSGLA